MSGAFLLFGGESYYPAGGWLDFLGSFDSVEAAKAVVDDQYGHVFGHVAGYVNDRWTHTSKYGWAHIVHEWQIVARFDPDDNPGQGDGWSDA